MRQTNVRGSLSLRGFRKLRTGAIVATGVILLGLGFLAPTVSASEQDGVWVARTVEEVKADLQNINNLSHYTIKWGDTLSAISGATGLSVDSLVEINRIANRDLIFANNKLYFSEEAFLKDGNTEVKRQRVSIENSGSRQSYEVETKTDTVTGEQRTTVKQTTPVAVGTPAVSAPKSETSVSVAPKAETRSETLHAPSVDTTNESGNSTESSPVTDKAPSNIGTTNQPVVSNPSSEASAPKAEEPMVSEPKAEEPATPAPKADEPVSPAPKEENLATPTLKEEKPATPAPKAEEPASAVEGTTAGEHGQPVEETPAPSKPEVPASTEEVATPAPKAEAPKETEKSEANATEGTGSEGATPGATAEVGETTGEASGTTSDDQGKEAKETEDAGEGVKPAPKEEKPATPAPKVEEPVTPAPKEEKPATPAPKEEKPATPAPKVEEPVTPAPKEEKPATPAPKAEAPKETEKSEANATEGTGSEGATPGATAEVGETTGEASGTTSDDQGKEAKETEDAGEGVKPAPKEDASEGKVSEGAAPGATAEVGETTGEASGITSDDQGKESKETEDAGEEVKPAPKEDASEGKVSEGAAPGATEEAGATGATSDDQGKQAKETEETVENTEETKQDEELKAFILEEIDNIITGEDGIATSKLKEIDKIQDEEKKAELKDKLKKLTEEAEIEIKKAKDSEDAISITEKYRDMIDAIEVPGEKYTKPNYDKDNLSNGRNDGTTIEGGSTAIGHGSGEAPSAATQPEAGTDNSSATTSSTQPATGTNSDSTGTAQPQPAVTSPASSAQPTNESSASTGAATESPAPTQPVSTETTSDSAPTAKPQPVATSETETSGTSSFRRAGEYRATARRVTRAANQPDGTVNINYKSYEMPDINGFLSDPGENNTVTIPSSATEEEAKALVKAKIQAKAKELAKYGYTVKEEIIFEQDTTVKNFNYVVTFTKETTGTTGFRIAPKVQVRAKKVAKRDLSNKTKQINIYYNLTALKDIAGALGELDGENVLTFSGETSKEDLKRAVEEKTKAQIEKLKKQGFTVTSKTDLDQIIEGGDSYDYVVEFTKESKTQPVGTSGFRMAPAVQPRASRNRRSLEQPAPQKVKLNVFYNFDQMKDIAGFLGDINGTPLEIAEGSTDDQVKAAVKNQVDAKKEELSKRGYTFKEDYVYQANGKDYNYVVTFSKAAK